MNAKKSVKAKVVEKNIIITIPIDTLVYAFNENPSNVDGWKVEDKNKAQFAKDFAKYLNEHETQNSQENGITAFEELLDNIGDAMCEDAVDSITFEDECDE